MTDNDSNKVALKFWVGALAFSILLMATTFALLSSYLATIKYDTAAALTRSDVVSQRLNTLDMEIAAIHHYILNDKDKQVAAAAAAGASNQAAPAPVAENASAPQPLVKDVTPPGLPAIQPPALVAPANNQPAAPAK